MINIFREARAFNPPIGNGDVGQVLDMRSIFEGARAFSQDISAWNVVNVRTMSRMFIGAEAFKDVNLDRWILRLEGADTVESMFAGIEFNCYLPSWQFKVRALQNILWRPSCSRNRKMMGCPPSISPQQNSVTSRLFCSCCDWVLEALGGLRDHLATFP